MTRTSSEDQGSGEREKGRRGGKGGTTGEGGANCEDSERRMVVESRGSFYKQVLAYFA